MKVILILNLALLGLVRAKAEVKVFELELSKVAVAKEEPAVQGELAERDMPLSELEKVARLGKYAVPIQFGSPEQTVWLAVYTAASDTWIECRNDSMTNTPSSYMGFDPKKSRTFNLTDSLGFEMEFLFGERILGDMVVDTMSLNSTPIGEMSLGAIPQSKIDAVGGLGLAAKKGHDQSMQPTFLDRLKERELIGHRAYSLYFDHLDLNHGRVIFGGVDTTKFVGKLCVLSRPPNTMNEQVDGFVVGLSGVDIVTSSSEPFQVRVPAEGIASLIESDAQFSYLPFEIVSQIAENIDDVSFQGKDSLLMISCAHKYWPDPQARVTLTLPRADGGAPVRINIPLAALVIEDLWAPTCLFGIQASSLLNSSANANYRSAGIPTTDFAIFGQTFLWHMYVVGDIDNDQIAVAPVNLGLDPYHPTNIVKLLASSGSISALHGVDSLNEQGQAPP